MSASSVKNAAPPAGAPPAPAPVPVHPEAPSSDAYGQQLFDQYAEYYEGQSQSARPPQSGQEYNDYVNLLFKDGGADEEQRQAAQAHAQAHAHAQAQAQAQAQYYAGGGYYGGGGYYPEGGYMYPQVYPPEYAYYQGGQDYFVQDERAYEAQYEGEEVEGEGEEAHAQALAKRTAQQALPLDLEGEGEGEGELLRQLDGLSISENKRSGRGRRPGPPYYVAPPGQYRGGARSWADVIKDGQGQAQGQQPMPMMVPHMIPPGMMPPGVIPPHPLAYSYPNTKQVRYGSPQMAPAFPPQGRGQPRVRGGLRGGRGGYGGRGGGFGRQSSPGKEGESLAANVHRRRGQSESGPVTSIDLGLDHLASINPAVTAIDQTPVAARFFVIKSYSEDDVHKAIKYQIWTSTDSGNKRLDRAFREQQSLTPPAPVYLFFSVNASGRFCGVAEMKSPLDFSAKSNVWNQTDKWTGQFSITWLYIKDVPNGQFRHIRLPNNDNKPVTNSRDTQEVPGKQGREVLKIFAQYQLKSSVLDDWSFYNEAEEQQSKQEIPIAEAPAEPEAQ